MDNEKSTRFHAMSILSNVHVVAEIYNKACSGAAGWSMGFGIKPAMCVRLTVVTLSFEGDLVAISFYVSL